MVNIITGDQGDNFLHGTFEDDILRGLGGDDVLMGAQGNDTLEGGTGNDRLHGMEGNNTYLFGRGDGQDMIMSFDSSISKHNTIRFGEDIAPSDITLERMGQNLVLRIVGSTDSITIDNYFGRGWGPDQAARPFAIEEIRFFDGARWDQAAIVAKLNPLIELDDGDNSFFGGANVDGKGGNDHLMGSIDDDVLRGGDGNDTLVGFDGDDVLVGGAGDDQLDGGAGANTFRFAQGWGHDSIALMGMGSPLATIIEIAAALPGTLTLSRSDNGLGNDLVIGAKGASDTVTVTGYFDPNLSWLANSVRISYADHSVWDHARIAQAMMIMPEGVELAGTDGPDWLYGSWGKDRIDGGAGDDNLDGMQGNDVLLGGAGNDQLRGGDGDDLLDGGAGNDILEGGFGNDVLIGADGHDQLNGGDGDDILDAGAGDAMLDGGSGNNIVLFGRSAGEYRFMPRPDASNTILVGADVRPEDVLVSQHNSWEISIAIRGTEARIVLALLPDWPNGAPEPSETFAQLKFADGTVWDSAIMLRQLYTGDDGHNQIFGSARADTIDGRGGNDILEGNGGNDKIRGGSGNDMLNGNMGNDVLLGQDGDDHLIGGEGDDILNGGAGDDFLFGDMGSNVFQVDLHGGADRIMSWWGPDAHNTLQFGAGIAPEDVLVRIDANTGELLLSFKGSSDTVTVMGYRGNDLRPEGLETVRFANGVVWNNADIARMALTGDDNNNWLEGGAGNDTLDGKGGDDTLKGNAGDDVLQGGDGNDFMDGGSGANTFVGGRGNDQLHGREEADTYLFHVGDGMDVINENAPGSASNVNVIRFGAGIDPASLHLELDGATLRIRYGVQDEVSIMNFYTNGPAESLPVNRFEFADNSVWTYQQLSNHAPQLVQQPLDQQIDDGAPFQYTLPANMFIDPDAGDSGVLAVQGLPAGFNFDARTGTIFGVASLADVGTHALSVSFTDRGGLSASTVFSLKVTPAASVSLTGTAGADMLTGKSNNDLLRGLGGDDILNGGLGADRLEGGTGNDTFHVDNAGDLVVENLAEGTDTVISSISYTLGSNVERLTLTGNAAINATGNALNNTLTGNSGANLLNGGSGGDSMAGGAGNDTYMVDNTSDAVIEGVDAGFDRVISSVGRTLGVNQEALTLTGTAVANGTGNLHNNLIQGNGALNSLSGGDGIDILQGGAGDDTLSDTSAQGGLLDGGLGADRLSGGAGAELFIGGAGNDTITTGTGADIIAFNRGGGVDSVSVTNGSDNTVSLGKGILYSDLALTKSGSDLVLKVGQGEQISFRGWYSSADAHSVGTLQVVTAGGADYVAGSASAIHDNLVEQFNFSALAARFDQLRVGQSASFIWNLGSSLDAFSSGGSDNAAIGADLAYQYALNGSLSALSAMPALAIIGSASFGTGSQVLQGASALNDGIAVLY
jgi:Ca2+-binding RTX toxin-like protein